MEKKTKTTSEGTTFTQKLIKALGNIKGITKDGANPHFKSKYITLDNINNAVNPVLWENGLYLTHKTSAGVLLTEVTDGVDSITTEWVLTTIQNGTAQNRGSELTYAKRYNISALLNLAVDEDDDGNLASSVSTPSQRKVEQMPVEESMVLDLISQAETQEELGKLWSELNGVDKTKYKPIFTKKRLELEGGTND